MMDRTSGPPNKNVLIYTFALWGSVRVRWRTRGSCSRIPGLQEALRGRPGQR